MFLLAPDGSVLETTHTLDSTVSLESLIRTGETQLLFSERKVYQVAVSAVQAPDLIAWVGMGYSIDVELARQLKELALTDVTFIYASENTDPTIITTLPALTQRDIDALDATSAADTVLSRLNNDSMISHRFTLSSKADSQIDVILTNTMSTALAEWRPWERGLWVIGLASLLFSGFTGWLISRSATRPVTQLVQAAQAITGGNYEAPINVRSSNEFGFLADSMNAMGTAVREREQKILHQARYDAITQLPTRQYIAETLDARATSEPITKYATLLLAVNKFDQLTEAYGMNWGDELLRLLAQTLGQQVRATDMIARVGRDQFLIFCAESSSATAANLARQIDHALERPLVCSSIEVKIDVRMGIAASPEHGTALNDLLRRAAIALSRAGVGADGLIVYEDGQDLRLMRQLRVTQRLQRAIAHGGEGLELHYQPKLDISSGSVDQVEALLRWTDDELGKVFPDEFIPLAESSGDILPLSEWVLAEAASRAARWREENVSVKVGVNVSGRDFMRADFVSRTIKTVTTAGARPEDLVLEVTESATIDNIEQAIKHLSELREAGFILALDDFGTGFSSLSQLKHLPVHELKIDKSFVLNLSTDSDDPKIVRSTIELGHNLGLKVVAEGVEDDASLKMLADMGCDSIQGYLLARPLAQDDFTKWWRNHESERRDRQTSAEIVGMGNA